jgi:hypothetical protein
LGDRPWWHGIDQLHGLEELELLTADAADALKRARLLPNLRRLTICQPGSNQEGILPAALFPHVQVNGLHLTLIHPHWNPVLTEILQQTDGISRLTVVSDSLSDRSWSAPMPARGCKIDTVEIRSPNSYRRLWTEPTSVWAGLVAQTRVLILDSPPPTVSPDWLEQLLSGLAQAPFLKTLILPTKNRSIETTLQRQFPNLQIIVNH